MKRVGLVGWRGMVGSVLMQRMLAEDDFSLVEPVFFTTSNVGGKGPAIGKDIPALKDTFSIEELKAMDVIISCQGGDYTNDIFPKLRADGWNGYWIDAASRSEEHTSELQSRENLVCRLLLEKKNEES